MRHGQRRIIFYQFKAPNLPPARVVPRLSRGAKGIPWPKSIVIMPCRTLLVTASAFYVRYAELCADLLDGIA